MNLKKMCSSRVKLFKRDCYLYPMNRNIARMLQLKQYQVQINGFMNSDSSNHPKNIGHLYRLMGLVLVLFFMASCNSTNNEPIGEATFKGISPSKADDLQLADGFSTQLLIKGLDKIGEEGIFGFDVSGIHYMGGDDAEGTLWVNHEFMNPMLVSGLYGDMARMRSQIKLEQDAVGSSVLSITRKGDLWQVNSGDQKNKRISADTEIPINGNIAGKNKARGTTANRSVVETPWNSIITTETDYQQYYGDIRYEDKQYIPSVLQWEAFTNESPYLYGWIVETSLSTKTTEKIKAPGRLKRGGIALSNEKGNAVLYSTDKRPNGSLYKFVSNSPDNLNEGIIYVADFSESKWIEVSIENSTLNDYFKGDQDLMLIQLSLAGKLAGGTELDNPSGVVMDQSTGDLLVTITNNLNQQRYHGSILKISDSGDGFSWDTVLEGGIDNNISCPSNLLFDNSGNLWISTSIPSQLLNQGVYTSFGNNGLFVLPKGQQDVIQIASAPTDANFSGMTFTNNDKFLFLGVQQPGSRSTSIYDFDFTSHWPEGGKAKPLSGVVVLGRSN